MLPGEVRDRVTVRARALKERGRRQRIGRHGRRGIGGPGRGGIGGPRGGGVGGPGLDRAVALAGAVLAVTLVGACAGPPVAASPQPVTGVFQQLTVHDGTTVNLVSGDPGCDIPAMVPFAVHAQIRVPSSSTTTTDVYLFTYENRAAYDRQAVAFEECKTAYATSAAAGGRPVDELDISPFRAFGPGWTPEVRAALLQSMSEAAGNGG